MIYILLLLSITLKSNAAIVGHGRGSVGVSLDQDDISAGMEGSYSASVKTRSFDANSSLSFEKVFDDSRSAPGLGHSYEYNSAYINSEIDHKYKLASPNLSWASTTKYNYDADEINSEPQSWALLTGPKYSKYIRSDIELGIELQKARELDSLYLRDEMSGAIRLSKSINARMVFKGEIERYCTEYNNNEIVDSCSNEASGEMSVRLGVADYRIRFGRLTTQNKIYPTYEADYNYSLNTSNIFSLRFSKKNNTIRNNVLTKAIDTLPAPATFSTTLIGSYLYNYKQMKLLMETNSSEMKTDTQLIQEQRYSIRVDYRLINNICKACFLNFIFDRNNNEVSSWQSTSLGIDVPWIRALYNRLAIKYTNSDSGESYYSLVFIINYNGRSSILLR